MISFSTKNFNEAQYRFDLVLLNNANVGVNYPRSPTEHIETFMSNIM